MFATRLASRFFATPVRQSLLSRQVVGKARLPVPVRLFSSKPQGKQKVVCVLYEGGEAGKRNKNILGCVQNELGLRQFVESRGHTLVVTSDKDGPNSRLEQELQDANVVISQPFWPAYITSQRVAKSPKLQLAITAGVGSDHVDLDAAVKRGMTVVEVTGCNVVSVAEHVVMMILALVRNYMPAYRMVLDGGWDIAAVADRAWDVEGMHIGTVGAGRIGYRVLQRLKPFDVHLHYYDSIRLPADAEKAVGVTFHSTVQDMVKVCDVVTINCPLHPGTEHLFNASMLAQMKRGSYLVNTARGKIVDTDALVKAVDSGHIAGYAGDVWYPQPASRSHPWRLMPRHAMTPHVSATTLSAQRRYAAGVKEILTSYFDGTPIKQDYLIVDRGKLVSRSYTPGNTTTGAL